MKVRLIKKIFMLTSLLLVAIVVSIFTNYRYKETFMKTNKKLPIYCVDIKEKKVAITFDVSLGDEYIDQILNILDKYNVKATFFIVGDWIDRNPDKLKEIYRRGHEIGNHSNRHPNMTNISKERIIEDININEAKIRNITGSGTELFRCPEGAYNDTVIDTVKESGYYCIQWDVDSIDWKEQGADIEYNRIIKNTKPGSILLFHNTAKYTPENLPKIIKKLSEEGYKFVKVGDLIYKNNYELDNTGKQISN
ncbi:polysaccharide deacetylase family sporulation protein PdaB [Clostridium sp. WILCCON 0269]|uniref:Polysaccharide deacetylase family sporulation protein PdaB n=1 Tax=Candidatus Clostridium eludens TaxID=3381663 RepID=A0ABW8SEU8_9CLOT